MSYGKVALLMVLTALFWSGAFIAGKYSAREFPPFALTFFRFFFALPVIFAILYLRQPDSWLPKRNEWKPLVLLGFLGTFLYHVFFFTALRHTTAINASLIGATNPMITTLLTVFFLGEQMSKLRLLGIGLSFFGVVLVVSGGSLDLVRDFALNVGDIWMFTAVCCWASYAVISRRVMQSYSLSPLMLTAYTFLICTVIALPFLLWEDPASYLANTSWGGWLSILYMAIFASVLGYLFQLVAIQHIGAPRAAVFVNLVPVFTIGQAWFFLGEAVTVFKLISAGLIITGVYLTVRPQPSVRTVKA